MVKFLDELDQDALPEVLARLEQVSISDEQQDFSLPAATVLEASRQDPSRKVFAIFLRGPATADVVGLGVLQPGGADKDAWPSQQPHVLFRGFSIDVAFQGQGIGTAATRAVLALARQRFPQTAVVLQVHVDNVAGQRAYERAGFTPTGVQVVGRAGDEYVFACPS